MADPQSGKRAASRRVSSCEDEHSPSLARSPHLPLQTTEVQKQFVSQLVHGFRDQVQEGRKKEDRLIRRHREAQDQLTKKNRDVLDQYLDNIVRALGGNQNTQEESTQETVESAADDPEYPLLPMRENSAESENYPQPGRDESPGSLYALPSDDEGRARESTEQHAVMAQTFLQSIGDTDSVIGNDWDAIDDERHKVTPAPRMPTPITSGMTSYSRPRTLPPMENMEILDMTDEVSPSPQETPVPAPKIKRTSMNPPPKPKITPENKTPMAAPPTPRSSTKRKKRASPGNGPLDEWITPSAPSTPAPPRLYYVTPRKSAMVAEQKNKRLAEFVQRSPREQSQALRDDSVNPYICDCASASCLYCRRGK